tara:strand:- start:804 stop:2648 length:1845 start_codon:yes stop_codon:yes gene_type:complete
MARDLNIKGTAGIVDTDKYVYRKERDMTKTQVDWDAVTTDLTKTINDIRDDRENRKAEIEKTTRERMNQLQELEQYDNQSLNSKIIGMSNESGNFIQSQNDLMRRGLISPSEFLQTSQNVSDQFKNVKNAFSKFDADFKNAETRTQKNESNMLEQYGMRSIAGFGNLANMDYYVNPTTGTLSFVKKQFDPKTGEPIPMTDEYLSDPANHLSMNTINVRMNSKSDYQNTTDAVNEEVKKLGEIVTVDPGTRQSVTTYEDWYQLEDSKEIMDNLVSTVTNNPAQKISILQDIGYSIDDFTQDPKEAEADPRKILVRQAEDGSGRLEPVLNEEQEKNIKQHVTNMFAAQISRKAGFTKGYTPPPPRSKTSAEIKADADEDIMMDYGKNVDMMNNGTPTEQEAAMNYLVDASNGAIQSIDKNGNKYTITYSDGRTVEKDLTGLSGDDANRTLWKAVNAPGAYDGYVQGGGQVTQDFAPNTVNYKGATKAIPSSKKNAGFNTFNDFIYETQGDGTIDLDTGAFDGTGHAPGKFLNSIQSLLGAEGFVPDGINASATFNMDGQDGDGELTIKVNGKSKKVPFGIHEANTLDVYNAIQKIINDEVKRMNKSKGGGGRGSNY